MNAVFEGDDVVIREIAETGQQRIEAFLDLRLAGGGHRAERATVKRLLEGDDFETGFTIGLRTAVAEAAGGFDQSVIRLGAGV